jgi:RNA polymerase sigma-70 factor (ECF subfamily)
MLLAMTEHDTQLDHSLMQRLIERDQHALTALYERYGGRVYAVAHQVMGRAAAAEDVMQDVFFQVWRWPERWNPAKGALLNWLLTVTRYTAIDHLRRERHGQTLDPQVLEEVTTSANGYHGTDAEEVDDDDTEHIRQTLMKLPKEQRVPILLAYFRGMTHEDIAAHLGIPLGTVKSRIRLGMQKLRDALTEHQPPP